MLDSSAFNRTIVELKLGHCLNSWVRIRPFNRTIVELKPRFLFTLKFCESTFNRTIVELKHVGILADFITDGLLIEPLWN